MSPPMTDFDGGVVVDFAFQGFLGQVAIAFSDDQDEPFDGPDAGKGPQAPGENAAAGEGEEALLCAAPNRAPLPAASTIPAARG